MVHIPKTNRVRDTVSIAGWLFADLLLGLAMLFLVFNTVGQITPPQSSHTPSPSVSPTSTPRSRKTPVPNILESTPSRTATHTTGVAPVPKVTETAQIGLDLTPSLVIVNVDAPKLISGDLDEIDSLRTQLSYKLTDFKGKRVGLVITLGYHQTVANGMMLARTGNKILLEESPELFDGAVMKPFWYSLDDNHPVGTITFELYFFTNINAP